MREIAKFASPKEHYEAGVCIVWCYDDRVKAALALALKSYKHYDLVCQAGGAKGLAKEGPDRDFLLKQIETSIRLHYTKKIVISNHSDCGAYGGLKAFDNDPVKEMAFHDDELKKIKEFLKNKFPQTEIQALYVDFEKIYEVK